MYTLCAHWVNAAASASAAAAPLQPIRLNMCALGNEYYTHNQTSIKWRTANKYLLSHWKFYEGKMSSSSNGLVNQSTRLQLEKESGEANQRLAEHCCLCVPFKALINVNEAQADRAQLNQSIDQRSIHWTLSDVPLLPPLLSSSIWLIPI